MVLDEAVRLHDVGPDLTAEGNIQLAFVEFVGVRLALFNFFIIPARAEHLHSHFAILALTALGLARHNDIGWKMGDADSGLDLVDVLAAFTSRAKRVHAQVFRPDVDLDAVVDFWNHEDGSKRSVAPRGLIEGGDSNETVNPGFSRQKTVGIFAGKLNRGGFDAGLFARSLIENLGGHSLAFRPSQIHAKKNGCPILGFRAARAGLDSHDGVEV